MPERVTFPFLPRASRNPFVDRSNLAAAVGRIVTQWNWIEVQIQHLFITLVGDDFYKAAEALYGDFNRSTRMRSLEEVMEIVRPGVERIALPTEGTAKLRQSFDLWFRARGTRNAVVHGLWQAHPRAPDKVILLDKAAYLRFVATELQQRAIGILTRTTDLTDKVIAERRSDAIIQIQDSAVLYGEADFEAIESDLGRCLSAFLNLNQIIEADISVEAFEWRREVP